MVWDKDQKSGDLQRDDGRTSAPDLDASERSLIPGLAKADYLNFIARALQGDPDVPPIFLAIARANSGRAAHSDGETNAEWWDRLYWQYILQEQLNRIDEIIRRYGEMADWDHAQAELARQRMREAGDRLQEIDDFVNDVDEIFRGKERGGAVDRERAMCLLKSRGVEVDQDADGAALLVLLKQEQTRAVRERAEWTGQYERSSADADYHDRQERENRRLAQELAEKRDAARRDAHDPQSAASALESIAQQYATDVRMKALEIEKAKGDGPMTSERLVERIQSDVNAAARESSTKDFLALRKMMLSQN